MPAIVLIGGLVVYWLYSVRLSVSHVVAAIMVPIAIGAWELHSDGRASGLAVFATTVSPLLIGLGYHAASILRAYFGRRQASSSPRRTITYRGTRAFIYLGSVYYFASGGAAIFSSNVEVSRLTFNSGGFFGLPGRIYLFGLPLSVALAAAEARTRKQPLRTDRAFVVALVALVISRLLSGFKSGLLEVMVVVLILRILSPTPLRPIRAVRKLAFPLVAALLFAYLLGQMYATYRATGSPTDALLSRLTTVAASSTTIVFDGRVPLLANGHGVLWNDFNYYFAKYFHVGQGPPFSFGQDVSSALVGESPNATTLAPVTTGSFADLYFQFGLGVAVIGEALIGAVLCIMSGLGQRKSTRPRLYLLAFAGCEVIVSYATKGDFAYAVTNWATVLMFMYGIMCIEQFLRSIRHGREHAARSADATLSEQHRLGLASSAPAGTRPGPGRVRG